MRLEEKRKISQLYQNIYSNIDGLSPLVTNENSKSMPLEQNPICKRKKQNEEEINYNMQEATIQETNPNTSKDTSIIIEELNSRYDQTLKITGMISELHTEGTDIFGGSHTQIEQDRDQIVNIVGKVQVQGTTLEQEIRTIELSNITQIDKMEVEDTQAQATIRSWDTENSE
ncbi:21486_t:CDS:2 [Gigaspora margarita]|uniref:21486_t:CDS:1 n=1 Tax=Gigaspora margarita TaxID=4874 RepID=A0ABN7VXF8_GIGMA|nr:21486_t:CDS:2 [Gigaspora margarita]